MLPPVDHLLTQPEATRAAVVAVLAWVMGADGELRPEEQAVVADTRRRLGVPAPPVEPVPSWSEDWPTLLTPIGGEVLLHAALLATADGDLAPPEEQCLALLAEALGLGSTAAGAMVSWAREGHRWMRRGTALISDSRHGGYAPT